MWCRACATLKDRTHYLELFRWVCIELFLILLNKFRDFWRASQEQNEDSDSSEPEISRLFNPEFENDNNLEELENEESKRHPKTPAFLIQMRKRQAERAEKREEIKKYHELREQEKKRQVGIHKTCGQKFLLSSAWLIVVI